MFDKQMVMFALACCTASFLAGLATGWKTALTRAAKLFGGSKIAFMGHPKIYFAKTQTSLALHPFNVQENVMALHGLVVAQDNPDKAA